MTERAQRADALDAAPATLEWVTLEIQSGDTLGGIFHRRGLRPAEAIKIAGLKGAAILSRLLPGRKLQLGIQSDGGLGGLRYELGPVDYLLIERDGSSYRVSRGQREVDVRQVQASGLIESSLFKAGADSGLSEALMMQLAEIFAWDIDFSRDLRRGDRFSLIYEEQFSGDEKLADGSILAAEFVHTDATYRAILFEDAQGGPTYYTPDGQSLRRTFLRSPVKYSRITSRFSKRRLHPVLKKWRAHKGVDYAGPTGTPVLATAHGRVAQIGNQGGYGKTVVLQHGGAYSTLYAHLSRYPKNLRRGSSVRQGQVIGYIGSTGLATGPHLHYEFRLNGVHRDPLRFKQPPAAPIHPEQREAFLAHAASLVAQLDAVSPQAVALAD